MKKLKKTIVALALFILVFTGPVLAQSNQDRLVLEDIFDYFPQPFYERLASRNYLQGPGDFKKIIDSLNKEGRSFLDRSQEDLSNYFFQIDLDNFPNESRFFSGNQLEDFGYENKNEFMSNYYNKNYLRLELKDNQLHIEGVNQIAQSWTIYFTDKDGHKIDPSFLRTMPIKNKRFKKTMELSNREDLASMTISLNRHKLDKYYPSSYNFIFEGEAFKEPAPYKGNLELYESAKDEDPSLYLGLDHLSQEERELMESKAQEITQGLDRDYDKILAIHQWVSSNIYYDFDSLTNNQRGPNDAYHTYKDKRAVCQGYAELSLALARSVGIPTRLIYGYALGVVDGEDAWTDNSLKESSNHAWNEAFVDGRWLIFDSTWDSSNRYENAQFKKDQASLKYFDPSLKAFSSSHRIERIVDL